MEMKNLNFDEIISQYTDSDSYIQSQQVVIARAVRVGGDIENEER